MRTFRARGSGCRQYPTPTKRDPALGFPSFGRRRVFAHTRVRVCVRVATFRVLDGRDRKCAYVYGSAASVCAAQRQMMSRYSVRQSESEKLHWHSSRLLARLEDVGIHLLKNREMLQHKVMKRILELQRRVPELHSNLNRLLELLCVIEMDYSVSPVDCGTNTRHHTSRTVRPTHGTGRQRVRRPQPQVLDVDLSRARALFRALLSLPLPPSLAGLCSLSSISGGYVTRHVRAGRPRAVETWVATESVRMCGSAASVCAAQGQMMRHRQIILFNALKTKFTALRLRSYRYSPSIL